MTAATVVLALPPAPIRLVVPFAAGGDAEASARNLQRSLARLSPEQPLELVFLTGESGAEANRAVRSAKPDGRTLLLARVGSSVVQPALVPEGAVSASEFTALAVLEQAPLVCAVKAGSQITSMRDLLAAIAAAPGRLRYSASGSGSLPYMAVRYLLALGGLPGDAALPVQYKQGRLATQALVDGQVDFMCNNVGTMIEPLQAGRLRGLMTTTQGRLKALPQLQNAAELGWRDMQQLQGWSALVAPPGLSAEQVAHWRALLARVADDAAWQAGTEALGAIPRIRAIKDPAQYLRLQALFYERMVMTLGLRP